MRYDLLLESGGQITTDLSPNSRRRESGIPSISASTARQFGFKPVSGKCISGIVSGGSRARTTKCRIDGRVRDGAERFTRIRSRDGCRQLKGIVPAGGDARRESGIQSAFAFVSANASHVVGGRRQQGERAQEERRRRRRRRGMEGTRFSIFSSYPRVAPFSVKRPRSEKATGKSGARAAS